MDVRSPYLKSHAEWGKRYILLLLTQRLQSDIRKYSMVNRNHVTLDLKACTASPKTRLFRILLPWRVYRVFSEDRFFPEMARNPLFSWSTQMTSPVKMKLSIKHCNWGLKLIKVNTKLNYNAFYACKWRLQTNNICSWKHQIQSYCI